MYTAADVDKMFQQWKQQGFTKEELVVKTAQAELGWPYGWGAVGSLCTPDKRRYYSQRSSCPAKDAENLIKRCQVLNGSRSNCNNCEFYPGDVTGLNDCQGFVKQVCGKVGISFAGGGCTSMWNSDGNWIEKGQKAQMPNKVCLVFQWNSSQQNMQHVGLHIGDGVIIECATTVKYNNTSKAAWTHYAIPRGLGGSTPMPWRPTIRKGSTGEDVVYCQQLLMKLSYDLSPYNADGKYGNKTAAAVKAFQKDHGLNADGVVGPLTWDALENAVPSGDKLYTVCIKHLDKTQADAMKRNYPQAEVTEE